MKRFPARKNANQNSNEGLRLIFKSDFFTVPPAIGYIGLDGLPTTVDGKPVDYSYSNAEKIEVEIPKNVDELGIREPNNLAFYRISFFQKGTYSAEVKLGDSIWVGCKKVSAPSNCGLLEPASEGPDMVIDSARGEGQTEEDVINSIDDKDIWKEPHPFELIFQLKI